MKETIFVPGAVADEKEFAWGKIIKVGFRVKDLIEFAQKHANDRDFLNIEIVPKRQQGKGGSHFVRLDTWKPAPQGQQQPAQRPAPQRNQPSRNQPEPEPQGQMNYDPEDDVPF